MIDKKTLLIAQLFISGTMACLMTGFFGFLHFGPTALWLHEWAQAFVIAWPVAFCLSLVVGRLSMKLACRITGS
jgi:hypothetical protein